MSWSVIGDLLPSFYAPRPSPVRFWVGIRSRPLRVVPPLGGLWARDLVMFAVRVWRCVRRSNVAECVHVRVDPSNLDVDVDCDRRSTRNRCTAARLTRKYCAFLSNLRMSNRNPVRQPARCYSAVFMRWGILAAL
jgi:hypothetical protein